MKCIPKPSLVVIFVRLVSGLDHPGISAVAEAYVQGLADNLAFFVSKCGWEAFSSATCEACAALGFWRDSPWSSIGAFSLNVSAWLWIAQYGKWVSFLLSKSSFAENVEVKFSNSFCLCLEYFELSWFVCFWP